MSNNPYTDETIKWLKATGWAPKSVETGSRFNRFDLLGFIDILAIKDGKMMGVQSTSWDQHNPHLKKIFGPRVKKNAIFWLSGGATALLISWKFVNNEWVHREQYLTLGDLT